MTMETYFERFTLDLPADAIADCSGPGAADDAVAYWAPRIERPEDCTPEALSAELREYGAWDDDERADDEANWRRIVWLACCQAKEEQHACLNELTRMAQEDGLYP
jgi:hypothetical protein